MAAQANCSGLLGAEAGRSQVQVPAWTIQCDSQFFFNYLKCIFIYVHMCVYVSICWVCAGACRGQSEYQTPLALGLQVDKRCPVWVCVILTTEPSPQPTKHKTLKQTVAWLWKGWRWAPRRTARASISSPQIKTFKMKTQVRSGAGLLSGQSAYPACTRPWATPAAHLQVWWHTPVISALQGQRLQGKRFKAIG